MQQVLFLCTGNYYRSRLAEEMFNHLAALRRLPVVAISRGLGLDLGKNGNIGPISTEALRLLKARNITPRRAHEWPTLATAADLESSHPVIALRASEHLPMIAALFPAFRAQITCWDIPDIEEMPPSEAARIIFCKVQALVETLRPQVS